MDSPKSINNNSQPGDQKFLTDRNLSIGKGAIKAKNPLNPSGTGNALDFILASLDENENSFYHTKRQIIQKKYDTSSVMRRFGIYKNPPQGMDYFFEILVIILGILIMLLKYKEKNSMKSAVNHIIKVNTLSNLIKVIYFK